MNKTISVNISGIIFNIEEAAYEKLGNYLNTIKRYFSANEGGDEIMADIESRIAELFQDRITPQKQVINLKDVEEIIAIMGQPEEYIEEDPEREYQRPYEPYSRRRRRVFRDPDNRIIGGVCSGISAYFGWDPLILRVLLVILLLSFGIGLIPYLILWIIIPKAKTTADKLEMRGEPVTVENIGKKVNQSFHSVKNEFNQFRGGSGKFRETGAYKNTHNGINDFFHFLGHVLSLFVKAILRILGFLLILVGIFIILGLISAFLGKEFIEIGNMQNFSGLDWKIISEMVFLNNTQYYIFLAGAALVILIPLAAIIYSGAKLLFKFKSRDSSVGMVFFLLWLVGLALVTYAGITLGADFKSTARLEESVVVPISSDTLHLTSPPRDVFYKRKWKNLENDFDHQFEFQNDSLRIGFSTLDVERNYESDQFILVARRKASGSNMREAAYRAENITWHHSVKDSAILQVKPYITIPKSEKFRAQNVKFTLLVPVGKAVFLAPGSERIIYDIKNVTNTWDRHMIGHTWFMTENGLVCTDCDDDNKKNND